MAARLSEGQRKARATIRAAVRKMLAELDDTNWRKECIEFRADFHLACIRYDQGTFQGQPIQTSWPIYTCEIRR